MEQALKKITKTYIPTFYNKTTLNLVLFLSACFYENVEWMKSFFIKRIKNTAKDAELRNGMGRDPRESTDVYLLLHPRRYGNFGDVSKSLSK